MGSLQDREIIFTWTLFTWQCDEIGGHLGNGILLLKLGMEQ